MRRRDTWIAILFVVFIFGIFFLSIGKQVIPEKTVDIESEKNIQEANGTTQEGNKGTVGTDTTQETKKTYPHTFAGFQAWLNDFTDNLFLKDWIISMNTKITGVLSGDSYFESTQVLKGKGDYLFYKSVTDGNCIEDYKGMNHYSEEELQAFATNLTSIRDYCEERGVECYYIMIPNKEVVCADFMPDTIIRLNKETKTKALANYLWTNTDLKLVYPEDVLIEKSKEHQLFYKTDTHLNQCGAFVVFQEFLDMAYGMREELEDVEFEIKSTTHAGDLANIAGVAEQYALDTVYSFKKESANPDMLQDKTVLMVGDSFSGFLSTIAKGYFTNVEWIYTQDFKISMLEEYDADVIVWETAMRRNEIFKDVDLTQQK